MPRFKCTSCLDCCMITIASCTIIWRSTRSAPASTQLPGSSRSSPHSSPLALSPASSVCLHTSTSQIRSSSRIEHLYSILIAFFPPPDFLFAQGTEVIFKVALCLLSCHEGEIVECDSFEAIVDYLKTTLPTLSQTQMEQIMAKVETGNYREEISFSDSSFAFMLNMSI